MPTCPSCGANLSPEWKFCIYCGAVAATVSPKRRAASDRAVPGAIRPDGLATARRSRLDVPLLIGIVLGTAGVGIIVYMAVLLFGPR